MYAWNSQNIIKYSLLRCSLYAIQCLVDNAVCICYISTYVKIPTNYSTKATSLINFTIDTYGTTQFKLYTCVQVHVCACTFNTHKISKTVVCTHFCTWFWRAHTGKQAHTTHERCTSRARTWFATLHMWCNYRYSSSRQWNTTALQLIGFFICCNEHRLKIQLKRHGHTEYSRISSSC